MGTMNDAKLNEFSGMNKRSSRDLRKLWKLNFIAVENYANGLECVYARPHPGPMTRSLPLARSSRTSGFAQIPFAASQAAQVPRGEGEILSKPRQIESVLTRSNVGVCEQFEMLSLATSG